VIWTLDVFALVSLNYLFIAVRHMDSNNPTSLFFDEEDVDLYAVLSIQSTATEEVIKRAYRKLALIYHPDKHATSNEDAKQAASRKFQQVGFAYTVLSDKKRRAKYDATGSTEEGFDLADGEDGWEAYFEVLFESVTRDKLDQLKKEYQGERDSRHVVPSGWVCYHFRDRLARGDR
jgi:DnaJ family protein C protein 9